MSGKVAWKQNVTDVDKHVCLHGLHSKLWILSELSNQDLSLSLPLFSLSLSQCLFLFLSFYLARRKNLFYIFTPPWNCGGVIFSLQFVCVCVCVCVCPSLCLWTKFQPNGFTVLDAVSFRYTADYYIDSDPIDIGDLGSKVKVTVTQYPFYLHNSLLISQQ